MYQGLAVVQRHRRTGLPQQQAVLGQEAGEQHAVPVLVGHFPDQVLKGLAIVIGLLVAQGTTVGAQAAAQGLERLGQVVRGLGLSNGQLTKSRTSSFLRNLTCGFDGVLKLGAQGLGQG